MFSSLILLAPPLLFVIIHALAALLPAVILLRYIYRSDTVEKEPASLLISLFFAGVFSALAASVAEEIGIRLLNRFGPEDSRLQLLILAFVVIGVSEEGAKMWLLKRRTWHHPAFNYYFDGIVYAVFVSLGFAAFENIGYVFGYGLSAAALRALTAVPGHLSFGVFMGIFYSRARACENWGDDRGCRRNLWASFLTAVFFHGFYDACAMVNHIAMTVVFVLFTAGLFWWVFRLVRWESERDTPI